MLAIAHNVVLYKLVIFRIYLLKQIVRKHGLDAMKKIIEVRNLSWVLPEHLRQAEVKTYDYISYLEIMLVFEARYTVFIRIEAPPVLGRNKLNIFPT